MNKVLLVGRLSRDVEFRSSSNGNSVARFTVAVNRNYKNSEGTYDADFVSCVAFKRQAEFISQYFKKGSWIAVVGGINTSTYEDANGEKKYRTDVLVNEVNFVGAAERNNDSVAKPKEDNATDLFAEELEDFVDIPF